MPTLRFAAAILFAGFALGAFAQSTQPPRPKVALVLSGGGARGLAHIGVLKLLHDARAGGCHRRHEHGLDRGRRRDRRSPRCT